MNSSFKRRIIEGIVFILGILFFIILYQLFAWHQQNTAYSKDTMKLLVPNANVILKRFFVLLTKPKTYKAISFSMLNLILSTLIGGIIGILLGVLGGVYKYVRIFLKPFISVFRCSPVVILVIILILALKEDNLIPTFATILVVMPIFYEGSLNGIKSIDKDQIDAYRMYSNFNLKVIRYVYLPAIWYFLKTSLVTSISFGFKVLISTEYLSSTTTNIGYLMKHAREVIRYADLYAYLIMVLIIVLLIEMIPVIIKNIRSKEE